VWPDLSKVVRVVAVGCVDVVEVLATTVVEAGGVVAREAEPAQAERATTTTIFDTR